MAAERVATTTTAAAIAITDTEIEGK